MKPVSKQASGGFSIHDALYVIFKHRWKIIVLSLLGFLAAGAMYYQVTRNPTYESTAKLMVRYVVERATIDQEASNRMNSGGMQAEMEILTSRDTAVEVAETFGPERLLPDVDPPADAARAASKVAAGLSVENPGGRAGSNFLYVNYRHEDPAIAREALAQIVKTYFEKHLELHRSTEAFAQVQRQTDQARSTLRQTEEEINRMKEESGVLTIEATINEFEARRQGIRESQLQAQAQLAEQRAKVVALEKSYQASELDDSADTSGDEDPTLGPDGQQFQRERSRAVGEYRNLAERLAMLQQRRNELLIQRKPGHPMVRALDRQIEEVRNRGLDLVEQYPEFAGVVTGERQAPVTSLEDEKALASAFEARLNAIEAQAKGLESEVARLSDLGFRLASLERQRALEDERYRYFQSSLEKAQIDETLDPSKIPNISVIQSPSPPVKSIEEDAMKLIAGIAASGLVAGLALAFLIEMVINRKVSRPTEIVTRLQLPLMLSIPWVRSKDGVAKLIGREPGLEMFGDAGDVMLPAIANHKHSVAENSDDHFITPYAAAIRDRIVFNFEVNNITHKPKLVAVTGLTSGCGTSTVAAGVAKAFAEDGDRKVLLVDLNQMPMNGTSQGRQPTDSLVRALQTSRQDEFRKSSRSLYFASAPTRRGGKSTYSLAPTKLHELMPYLSGSDFDYIVFDMPPVDPTSPTLAMAGFMDKVLLVLDAENTTRENLSWGYSELEKGRSDVSCIYNKARSHAPRWVQGGV